MIQIVARLLRHATAILASLRNVFHRTDFKGLGIRASSLSRCTSGRSAASRGGGARTGGPSHLYFVADVFAQLCRVSGQLIGVSILIAKDVVPTGATQATFNRSCAPCSS